MLAKGSGRVMKVILDIYFSGGETPELEDEMAIMNDIVEGHAFHLL